jgi:hypothetical protein
MFSGVSDTSKKAYAEITADGSKMTQEQIVFNAIMRLLRTTRAELSVKTGLRLASVCGRVNTLIAKGKIRENGVITDPTTNKTVYLLEAVK